MTTEFWDGVNFARGANPDPQSWVKPRRRTADDSERCYGVLRRFVQHMKSQPGVRFVTARDLPGLYARSPRPNRWIARLWRRTSAVKSSLARFRARCCPRRTCCWRSWTSSPEVVDGPAAAGASTYSKPTDSRDRPFTRLRRMPPTSSAVFTVCRMRYSSVPRLSPSPISRPPSPAVWMAPIR